MNRRDTIRILAGTSGLCFLPGKLFSSVFTEIPGIIPGVARPISIYGNWSAYDELSDNVRLDEKLAMFQLDELLRLKDEGAQFDYYLMDAFWFDKDGGYRTWRKEDWPDGPDNWLNGCIRNNVRPGLWLSTNYLGPWLRPVPEWKDSLSEEQNLLCLFDGGYLDHLIATMQMWYERGVRLFKFDFASFRAATPAVAKTHTEDEIVDLNKKTFISALKVFRAKNPDVILMAYNGFGGIIDQTLPEYNKTVDLKWLEAFDSLYSGDPRPSDIPAMNFWRSMDIYSDSMVRQFEFNGVPPEKIDNIAFMNGVTGTCLKRKMADWKGSLILFLARGGWLNTMYGNLDLIRGEDAVWFARVQKLFLDLQYNARIQTFGPVPDIKQPYGYVATDKEGSVFTIVNPGQAVQSINISGNNKFGEGRIIFRDAGFDPVLENGILTLGPEQMCMAGYGKYSSEEYDLGVQDDILIPRSIKPLEAGSVSTGKNKYSAVLNKTPDGDLRVVFEQSLENGERGRVSGGAPPDGISMDQLLIIKISQGNKTLPLQINYNEMIWSGLSWAVAEVKKDEISRGKQLEISYEIKDPQKREMIITGSFYDVQYS
jgi:hypothetical protein